MRVRSAMPLSSSAWPSTSTRSSSCTPSSSPAWAAPASSPAMTTALKTILDAGGAQGGARTARRVALHVDCHRVHRDVRRRGLDVHREGGRIAPQALRPDAEHVDRLRQLLLELRPFWVGAARAEPPRRGDLGEMHAKVRGAADAHADD